MYDLINNNSNSNKRQPCKKNGVIYAAGMMKRDMVKEMMMIPCLEEERKRSKWIHLD